MQDIPISTDQICRLARESLSLEIDGISGQCETKHESRFVRELFSELQKSKGIELAGPIKFPHPQLSFSHSKGFCWAMYGQKAMGLGFDIEKLRPLGPGALRFYANSDERELLPKLESSANTRVQFWAVKEALFKADMSNSGRRLRNYQVTAWPQNKKPGYARSLLDNQTFKFISLMDSEWAFGLAVRENPSS